MISSLFRRVLIPGRASVALVILSFHPAVVCVCTPAFPEGTSSGRYSTLLTQLMSLTPDPGRTAPVTSLVIRRDVATFTLGPGTIYFCSQVEGRDCAVVYRGKGNFFMRPSTDVERQQVGRFFGADSIDEEFTELLLLFGDGSGEELKSQMQFVPGNVSKEVAEFVEYGLKYLGDEDRRYSYPPLILSMLNGGGDGFFYAHFSSERTKPLFFEINPREDEEVRLMMRYPATYVRMHEIVSQSHTKEEYDRKGLQIHEEKREMDVDQYVIQCEIADNFTAHLRASLTVRMTAATPRWFQLYLFEELEVDSVILNGSLKCEFVKPEESWFLLFNIASPFPPGTTLTLDIFYRGPLIERIDARNWLVIKSSTLWYPTEGKRDKAVFDMTFVIPEAYELVSVGELVSSSGGSESNLSRWVTREPIRNASFNIGKFDKWKIEEPELPPVAVYMNESGHRTIVKAEDEVRQDIVESMKLFQHLFGPMPFSSLIATEIPYLHGEAFPGLLHLSWVTYESGYFSADFVHEGQTLFTAHEVAHQWWGVGVDFQNYHDQWISEAFADYSGLWYTQLAIQDNEKFFKILERWRDAIFSQRKFVLESGQEAGPVWLGYRTQGSGTKGDYSLVVYKKGAWILHMLRNMMINLKTMKEDAFEGMLRKFYTSHVGKRASTEDFRRVVEEYTREDMKWFFDQWVYGTDIPTYQYAYQVEGKPNGKYDLTVKVDQMDVPESFRMPVVICVVLEDGRSMRTRIVVSGKSREFRFPDLPGKPDEIIFNDLESVLCEVEETGWR